MKPRIVFMGTPDFAVPALARLIDEDFPVVGVVCQPDRPAGRRGEMKAPPVKQLAQKHQIPVLQPEKVRTPDFEAQLAALRPELIVTAAYGRILPKNILDLPPLGCLNVHASLLPRWRGAAPIQWALMSGDNKTGITIMEMDEGMDTGHILLQSEVPLDHEIDAGTLSDILSRKGAELLPQAVLDYVAGKLVPVPQEHDQATIAKIMTRETGEIDWTKSAEQIHNLIRGTYPWPGAYTACDNKRLKVHKASVNQDPQLREQAAQMAPGTICLCGRQSISVVCGEGVIDLLEIQLASGRRMYCRDCAHNYRLGQVIGGESS